MKKFTIGYINHYDQAVFQKHLKPSLLSLAADFDIIPTEYGKNAAEKYNHMIEQCVTPYLIITHQDIAFTPDLLDRIEETIQIDPDFGALGLVGAAQDGNHWSLPDKIFELDTLDSCFIVINMKHGIKFDTVNFPEVHLSTEDYCAQAKNLGKKIYTIKIDNDCQAPSHLAHHSYSTSKEGFCWGNYMQYRQVFEQKWPNYKTT